MMGPVAEFEMTAKPLKCIHCVKDAEMPANIHCDICRHFEEGLGIDCSSTKTRLRLTIKTAHLPRWKPKNIGIHGPGRHQFIDHEETE